MLTRPWPKWNELWPHALALCLLIALRRSGLAVYPAVMSVALGLCAYLFALSMRRPLFWTAALFCTLIPAYAWLAALTDGYTAFICGASLMASALVLSMRRPGSAVLRALLGALTAGAVSVVGLWIVLLARRMTPGVAVLYALRAQCWPTLMCAAGYLAGSFRRVR